MKRHDPGNPLAIVLLLCGTIWLVLDVSGLFRASPGQLPGWAGFAVALGVLMGPAILFLRSLHWVIRILAAITFLGCLAIFPGFYDRVPIYFWLTMLLVYVEVFGVIPLVRKRKRSPDEGSQPGSGRRA